MAADQTPDIQVSSVEEVACHQCGNVANVSGREAFSVVECPHCGAHFSVPGKLGHFVLLKILGRGGMGTTYKAYEKTLGRFVAIKVMRPVLAEERGRVREFLAEARTLASLNHPHVARAYSLGTESGRPYIVMEFVDGKPLDRSKAADEPMAELQALEIGLQVAGALAAAHRIGLIHGDVKPANILLDAKGQAKLVDFGAARFGGGRLTDEDALGTPYYVSPEQVRRESIDHRTDIYSLGATLFRCLTCSPPFVAGSMAEVLNARLKAPAPDLLQFRPKLHAKTARLVGRMLQADPDKRYATYDELCEDLREACRLAGGAAEPHTQQTPGRAEAAGGEPKWARLRFPLMLAGAALVLAAVAAAMLFLSAGDTAPAPQLGDGSPQRSPPPRPPQSVRVARPAFSPPGRAIAQAVNVTVSCQTSGAEIRYTTDGNDPTEASPVVRGPIRVQPGMTLKARAYREDSHPSEVAAVSYPHDSAGLTSLVPLRTEAGEAWGRAQRLDPGQGLQARRDQARRIWANAEEFYRRGAYPSARKAYQKLLALCRELAGLSRRREQAKTARQKATSVIEAVSDPAVREQAGSLWNQASRKAQQAHAAFERGDFAEAQRLWQSAEKDATAQQLALADQARRAYDRAAREHDVAKLASLGGAAWRAVTETLSRAEAARKDGRFAEVTSHYKRALELLAKAAAAADAAGLQKQLEARLAKARALVQEGKLSGAMTEVDAAIALKPWELAAWRMKNAILHRRSGWLTLPRVKDKTDRMAFVWIPPGEFRHGRWPAKTLRPERKDEQKVILSRGFYMGAHEVTRKQFSIFVGAQGEGYKTQAEKAGKAYAWDGRRKRWGYVRGMSWHNPGFEQKEDHPVVCVTWREAMSFCEWLSGNPAAKVTLPTEAQWEYACRAGTDTLFSFGAREDDLAKHGNYADQSRTRRGRWNDGHVWTAPVGKFEPNPWRLYDMHGNVGEWCGDWFSPEPAAGTDPTGPENGSGRVVRGGGWDSPAAGCRSGSRAWLPAGYPSSAVGFRVAATQLPDDAFTEKRWSALPPAPPKPDVHIADLKPLKATTGSERVQINRSCRGKALRIDEKEYEKGVGVHAPSELVYPRGPEYRRFVAVAGLDHEVRNSNRASVQFRVYGDDGLLAESPLLKSKQTNHWHFDVPIPPGVCRIRLIVTDGGNGKHEDQADWADAGFVTAGR